MLPREPLLTAVILSVFGALLVISVVFSRASLRAGVPITLIFLGLGMLAGSEGIGGIPFEDYQAAFRVGTVALVLILFDGGLNTPVPQLRRYAAAAGTLATVGVVLTAGFLAIAAHLLGLPWPAAFLLGAVVSSTDAAAVFSVLRGSGLHLKRRVGLTLEAESGINDPMAVLLTIATTEVVLDPASVNPWLMFGDVLLELVVGTALGLAAGFGGRALLMKIRLPASGLYPALTLGLACLSFSVPTLLHGSGFLAVYIAALILGNGTLPFRGGLLRVHDALAWLSQIVMFLMFGLLVFPSRILEVFWLGIALSLALALLARPLAVLACLAPFRYPPREIGFIGWVGLRGALPIILATYPVMAGVEVASQIFDVVFFIVVVSVLVQGGTVPAITRLLKLEVAEPPSPRAVLEIESMQPLTGDLMSFYVDPALAVSGVQMSDLPFPEGAAATLIVRGQDLVAPKGNTTLQPGDHVYIFCRPEDRALIQLMFGRPESD
ncbi:MAG TPA: potassium/proton antiporter [Gemmatimonadaceae bacterium]|nr:potassium/proton antiporter [Gemmatimonadaceae bacterium]